MRVDEPDRAVLDAARERRACDGAQTLLTAPDKQRIEPVTLGRPHACHDPIDHAPLREEPGPHEHRRDGKLHDHRLEPARPQRHPQGKRRRQRACDEQPLRIAPLVATSVVARQEQRHKQRRSVLPTVQDAGWQQVANPRGEPIAQPGVLAHRAHQLAHHVERREIGHHQDGEAAQRPHHVTAQVGRRALLQVEPDPYRRLTLRRRGRGLDGNVRGMKRRVRRGWRRVQEGSRLRLQLERQGFQAHPPEVHKLRAAGAQHSRRNRSPAP